MQTDAAIVARVLGGDADAYALLVARYRDKYTRFALHMLGDAHDAEEALQDAFVRAYRFLGNCTDPSKFGAWLLKILVNRCRTAGTRRGRREKVVVKDEGAVLRQQGVDEFARSEWREEIQRALAALDAAQREAFLLKYVEGMEYEEMAKLTGAGVSALKMRVKRACERLRGMLREVAHA